MKRNKPDRVLSETGKKHAGSRRDNAVRPNFHLKNRKTCRNVVFFSGKRLEKENFACYIIIIDEFEPLLPVEKES